MTKFPIIHDLQLELRQPNGVLTAEEKAKKEEELATAEGQATSWMQLTNETVATMSLFTKDLSPSFTTSEIVDRVAAMVNYTLNTLVGPKAANLKVENTQKYHFDAKTLLGEFVDIYLNLGVEESFITAVARDGRSYKAENLQNATRIIVQKNIKAPDVIESWKTLVKRFIAAKELDDLEEADMGEIPDEFMDPLMADWMRDPVILPASRIVIDKSVIASHLLSDPTDPFTRAPLKIEDVIPNDELKARITAWKLDVLAKAKAARDVMDMTED